MENGGSSLQKPIMFLIKACMILMQQFTNPISLMAMASSWLIQP
jgi:hypothetical protein